MKNSELKMKNDNLKLINKFPLLMWLLIALFIVRAFIYGTFTPAWQGPDEPLHYDYIHYLQTEKTLPVLGKTFLCSEVRNSLKSFYFNSFATEKSPYILVGKLNTKEVEAKEVKHTGQHSKLVKQNQIVQHPPLYYLAAAIISWPIKDSSMLTIVWFLRMLSALLGLGVVILTYLTVKVIYSKNDLPALGAAAFVAINPMFAHVSTVVNNDSLINFLFALFLFLLVKSCYQGFSLKRSALIGSVIGLGLLTKFFFIIALPMLAIALVLYRKKITDGYLKIALAFTGPLFIALPYYLRNLAIYEKLQPVYKFHFVDASLFKQMSFGQFLISTNFTRKLFFSFWSNFGWIKPRFTKIINQELLIASLLVIVGMVVYFALKLRERKTDEIKILSILIFAPLILVFAIAFNAFRDARITGVVEGVQGRYLFSLIGPMGLLSFLGIRQIIPFKEGKVALAVFIAGIALIDISAIFYYILPYFYF